MQTTLEKLEADFARIKEMMKVFLIEYSAIKYQPFDPGPPFYPIGFSDYVWVELDQNGKKSQAELYKSYKALMDLCKVLIVDLPPDSVELFEEQQNAVFSSIEQNVMVWEKSTQEVYKRTEDCLIKQLEIVNMIQDPTGNGYVFVPDTNALLTNTNLESWEFDGADKFEILLLPTVLAELDALKINHRNPEVREKAQGMIRRIKGLRGRGYLTDGVNLVTNKIMLRALAVEPKFENVLPWLEMKNPDDRIIASFVEVMRQLPSSKLCLVTADINLQNKAEFARLAFVEPPAERK